MSWKDRIGTFILKQLGWEEVVPNEKPKLMDENLIIKVEAVLTMGTELGMLESKELGMFMIDYVCPVCPVQTVCSVPEVYKMMAKGADKKSIQKKMSEVGKELGVDLKDGTPDFLKVKGGINDEHKD